jgi:DNA repair protein RecN (Recombination protein N)
LRELRRRHATLTAERQQRQRELALVRFEREELDNARLVPGELAELSRQRQRLAHTQAMQDFAQAGSARLYDEEGAVYEQFGKLLREAEKWVELDPSLADVVQRLQSLGTETQDLADTLRTLAGRWHADPERREEVEERFQLLRRLETKYAKSIDELISYRASLDEQAKRLQGAEDERAGLETAMTEAYQQLCRSGADLSKQRHKVAKRFVAEVQKHLADLGMREARFDAAWTSVTLGGDPVTTDVPSQGLEQLELMLAANQGEPPWPLRKVASGGELSRTMLALKTVLAAHDQVGTLVFDEIDANVGGRLGDVLGRKLAALGRTHQVICVTHLPQVASYARHQWTIRKDRHGKRTVTSIQRLTDAQRVDELASMLRGEAKGETTRQEAQAMLTEARKGW